MSAPRPPIRALRLPVSQDGRPRVDAGPQVRTGIRRVDQHERASRPWPRARSPSPRRIATRASVRLSPRRR